jgi:hypothetical protein
LECVLRESLVGYPNPGSYIHPIIKTSMTDRQIQNGDVYDIGQTVNGVSRFLWFNNTWYYFEERLSCEYEYNQNVLTQTVLYPGEAEDITFIKNIFKH